MPQTSSPSPPDARSVTCRRRPCWCAPMVMSRGRLRRTGPRSMDYVEYSRSGSGLSRGDLDLGHAAIDAQLDAGDEAAVIGGQKQCGGGDLLGAAQPVEWYRRGELRLVRLTVQHGGVNRTRAQRVE